MRNWRHPHCTSNRRLRGALRKIGWSGHHPVNHFKRRFGMRMRVLFGLALVAAIAWAGDARACHWGMGGYGGGYGGGWGMGMGMGYGGYGGAAYTYGQSGYYAPGTMTTDSSGSYSNGAYSTGTTTSGTTSGYSSGAGTTSGSTDVSAGTVI